MREHETICLCSFCGRAITNTRGLRFIRQKLMVGLGSVEVNMCGDCAAGGALGYNLQPIERNGGCGDGAAHE